MSRKIVILGAGPTGLGAGYRLQELGYHNFEIYDANDHLGGLASSFCDSSGFTWDIGGHVMFSHYKYYDQVFDRLMGNDYQLNMRESWVRMADRWIPYPFQNNIRHLPLEMTCECLLGLIRAQATADHRSATNFDQFIEAVFGPGIARHFMRPYNFKVWAHPATLMNKRWIGERVAVIDAERALKNVITGQDDFGWGPNNQFKFPLYGGTGEFYRRFSGPLQGHVHLGQRAVAIDMDQKQVRFASGLVVSYDQLITTLPLDKLCNQVICSSMPDSIRSAAGKLLHNGGHMVGIGLKQPCHSSKSWMYFPESNSPFYRVTYLSNYSPNMTPDNKMYYSLLAETSYSSYKPVNGNTIVQDTIDGIIKSGLLNESDQSDIVDTWHFEATYSYPIPSVPRDAILQQVIPFLEQQDIFSRGRFGLWKYEVSNTDHSLMQGVELVNRLLQDEPETTMGIEYPHESTTLAGSEPSALNASNRSNQAPGADIPIKPRSSTINGHGLSMPRDRASRPGRQAPQPAHPGSSGGSEPGKTRPQAKPKGAENANGRPHEKTST